MVLERGATRRRAPHNAASYLISRALRHGRRELGWQTVKAYSDPRYGEAGLVYKAVGFRPCPPSKHGDASRYGLQDGKRVLSDRAIYRRHGSHAGARARRRGAGTPASTCCLALAALMDAEQLTEVLSRLRQVEALKQKLGMAPVSAAALRAAMPKLAAVDAVAPGLIELIVRAAQGDPEAARRLGAIWQCPTEPESTTLQ